MFAKEPSLLSRTIKMFRAQSFSGLVATVGAKLPLDSIAQKKGSRNRIFSVTRTFWLFLYQVLAGNLSLDAMVQIARSWFLETDNVSASPNTSAYSQARKRLPASLLRDVEDQLNKQFLSSKTFHGYHVKLVDGTGISLQDTVANRSHFPMHPKAGCYSGFPSFKLLGLFDYQTGRNLEWAIDAINTSDSALFRLFWPLLNKNDLVVGDRHFCGFAYFAFLLNLGVHTMTRKHQMRKYQETVKKKGKGDLIVRWKKPRQAPKWLNKSEWDSLPESLLIREITFKVGPKGFRTNTIAITTTALDDTISAREWSELYFHRWKVELFLRDIKTTMGMDLLKGKTPNMIEKEVFLYFIAYNLIRLLMQEASETNGTELAKMSFKSTITAIQIWGPLLSGAKTQKLYEKYYKEFLKTIAYPRCRNRKNRTEPRAKKRRAKNFQLLTGDRHEFKPIPHRNKYKKNP